MRKEDVIAFARRDWDAVAAHKRRWWAEQNAHMTPEEALRIGDELRHYATSLHKEWPSDDERQKDLACHIRVSEMLRSVKSPDRR